MASFHQWLERGLKANAVGDADGAVAAFREALRIDPNASAAWSGLGLALLSMGRVGDARQALAQAHQADDPPPARLLGDAVKGPANTQAQACLAWFGDARAIMIRVLHQACRRPAHVGRRQAAAVLGGDLLAPEARNAIGHPRIGLAASHDPDRAPADEPLATIDGLAKDLDAKVVDDFEYDIPQHLADMLCDCASARMLDLGCGEGLMAAALGDKVAQATGVDISGAMLTAARASAVYDTLVHDDISDFCFRCRTRFDLVVAAGVFNRFGALDSLFADVHRVLAPGGYFAFSVDRGEEDWAWLGFGRFSHSLAYLTQLSMGRFDVVDCRMARLRDQGGRRVIGFLQVWRRH